MLTDEMRADGWIEHDIGPPPKIDGSVFVMWENGLESLQPAHATWWNSWDRPVRSSNKRLKSPGRIIAYRPEPSHDPR
jgi:hypothetical protein